MVLVKPANQHVLKLFSLAGKKAVVTGGSRGIGLEVARALAEAGADVAITYSTSKGAVETAARLASENDVKVQAYQADVRNFESITTTISQIAKDFGGLDVVVANAGISGHKEAEDFTREQYKDIMSTNVDGVFHTAQAAAKIFKPQGHGNLIITASISGSLVNLPQKQAVYNASKACVIHLAKSLAVEWVDWCRVNCISPGYISTEMIGSLSEEWKTKWMDLVPAKRFCDPAELKGAYVFCASDASSYMTGADIIIDGAYTAC